MRENAAAVVHSRDVKLVDERTQFRAAFDGVEETPSRRTSKGPEVGIPIEEMKSKTMYPTRDQEAGEQAGRFRISWIF